MKYLFGIGIFIAVFAASAVASPAPDITVAADGTGDVKTIQAAIDKVPDNNQKRFVITIKPGVYKEQIKIPANKPLISFIGTDAARTILTFNISNKEAGSTSAAYAGYVGGHDFRAE